jgi:hypothetical protein
VAARGLAHAREWWWAVWGVRRRTGPPPHGPGLSADGVAWSKSRIPPPRVGGFDLLSAIGGAPGADCIGTIFPPEMPFFARSGRPAAAGASPKMGKESAVAVVAPPRSFCFLRSGSCTPPPPPGGVRVGAHGQGW